MRLLRVLVLVPVAVVLLGSGCLWRRSARGGKPVTPGLATLDPLPPEPHGNGPVQAIRWGPRAPKPVLSYFIHEGDTLEISVWGEPDMTRSVIVLPRSGTISYEGEYNVRAAGRTEEEIARELASKKRLGRLIKEPRVSVRVVKATGNAMTVSR